MFQEIRVEPQRRSLLAIGFGRTATRDNGLAQLRLGQWLFDRRIGTDQLAGLDVDDVRAYTDVLQVASICEVRSWRWNEEVETEKEYVQPKEGIRQSNWCGESSTRA